VENVPAPATNFDREKIMISEDHIAALKQFERMIATAPTWKLGVIMVELENAGLVDYDAQNNEWNLSPMGASISDAVADWNMRSIENIGKI
jgi:hypothetical protein